MLNAGNRRMMGFWARAGMVCAVLWFACACVRQVDDDIAEPLAPQPYGADESNVELWLETMELSSRELYAARANVVAALGLSRGERIADVGAGTGLYSLLFADAVGDAGVVFAVDIEPRFLSLINQRVADLDIDNVLSVLSREDDITLPPGSVDAVFIADTYHYFTDPEAVLASVQDALRRDGRLFVVDYEMPDEESTVAARDHLRFGRDGMVEELESFGFQLVEEPSIEGLDEIYLLTFEKQF